MHLQLNKWSFAETVLRQNQHEDSDLWNLVLLADVLKDAINQVIQKVL